MADEVSYTEPIEARVYPGTTRLEPVVLTLDREEGAIKVKYAGDNGVVKFIEWTDAAGEDATGLIAALNTANLSIKSLKQRLNERALTDGKLNAGGTT